jgi:hypothetical protein
VAGETYQDLITEILAANGEKTARAVGRLTSDAYRQSWKRLSASRKGTVKLPDLSEVLPKRSVFLTKAAEDGKLINETLRGKLERDLRETLREFDGTGEQRMETQRGTGTGKMNPALIQAFQRRIEKTFATYTKRDEGGVPPQIRNIAVTEVRQAVGAMKQAYKEEVLRRNPGAKAVKTWVQNRQLSKKPRKGHQIVSGKTIREEDFFRVPRERGTGFDRMARPHDPNAPADQVIGCNCDLISRIILP